MIAVLSYSHDVGVVDGRLHIHQILIQTSSSKIPREMTTKNVAVHHASIPAIETALEISSIVSELRGSATNVLKTPILYCNDDNK